MPIPRNQHKLNLYTHRLPALALSLTCSMGVIGVMGLGFESVAEAAAPRDDIKSAYDEALSQYNNLDLEAAATTVEGAISSAEGGEGASDPYLASLYLLRAVLAYSTQGDGASAAINAALQKAVSLNYFVVVPIEMRSEALTGYLNKARKAVGAAPGEKITLTSLEPACGEDLEVEALLSVPDGGQAALYWRKSGDGEFAGEEMVVFSNVASFTIPAAGHGDESIEYFIYAFDQNNQPLANLGTQEDPAKLDQNCEPVVAVVPDAGTGEGEGAGDGKGEGDGKGGKGDKEPYTGSLPKIGWFNLGLGTGFGIARGTAENTYQQFFPNSQALYGEAEAACAMARWAAGTEDVVDANPALIEEAWSNFAGPSSVSELNSALAAKGGLEWCNERHPVSTGLASAPFHIQPELNFRVGKRMSLGVFARLQVVTGANVRRDDPNKPLNESFESDARSPAPSGIKAKIKFPWAIGAKFKYFFGKDTSKFRAYIGAFAGYGNTRLRVNMGFGNDENGNSVPDNLEVGADATDAAGSNCYPVWPYNSACDDAPGAGDNAIAVSAQANGAGKQNRIDVVRIGPGFVGALVGFNYQLHKNFALFGELNVGGWFPDQGSALFDLNVGPAITF